MTHIRSPEIKKIILPVTSRETIIAHCRRKLLRKYLADEDHNLKAYGLFGGKRGDELITVRACRPLLKNARTTEPHKSFMDEMMRKHAIKSETPFNKRGWVADPDELTQSVREFKSEGLSLVGTYHMHRVAWEHDRNRDIPTVLDTVLGLDSRMIMVIVSMVDPNRPIIRAFYEGREDFEIPIFIIDE